MFNIWMTLGIFPTTAWAGGSVERSKYTESLRAGLSGDRMPVEARFYAPLQAGSGFHPASYIIGTGSLSRGYSGRDVVLTTHSHVATSLRV